MDLLANLDTSSPRKLAIRSATGTAQGKLCSAVWGVWKSKAAKNDIYVAARSIGHQLKCSLHAEGYCYLGFTTEEFGRMTAEGRAPARREWVQWRRPATPENGFAVAVEIMLPPCQPYNETDTLDGKPTWVIGPPPLGKGVIVSVVFSRVRKGELNLEPNVHELGYARLSDGEYVVVFASLVDFDYEAFITANHPALQASLSRVIPPDTEHLSKPLHMFLVTEKEEGKPLRLLDASVTISKG